MKILGIETSCDETGAAVVGDGKVLLSNVVASSVDLHIRYGGVVPEIAARSHIEYINPVINQALVQAKFGQGFDLDEVQGKEEKRANLTNGTESESRTKLTQQFAKSNDGVSGSAGKQIFATDDLWDDIDAIAVTYGPGLGGSLLVGVLTARTLAIIKNKPLYAVNHVEAHVYVNFLTETTLPNYKLPKNQPKFPLLALIVSGGHTQLVLFEDHFKYQVLGKTQDDAVGEAFDKVAKILGLPYPGGPSVELAGNNGDPSRIKLPKAKMPGKYNFSYSGLKTAVLRAAQAEVGEDYSFPSHKLPERLSEAQKADIAASFKRTAIEVLVDKTMLAYDEFAPKSVVIAGGVAASPELRRQISDKLPIEVEYTDIKLCTDNAAMIAANGYFQATNGNQSADPKALEINPSLKM